MKPYKIVKTCPEFAKELDEMDRAKIKNDTLKEPVGARVMTKKILKSNFWQKVKEECIKNNFDLENE